MVLVQNAVWRYNPRITNRVEKVRLKPAIWSDFSRALLTVLARESKSLEFKRESIGFLLILGMNTSSFLPTPDKIVASMTCKRNCVTARQGTILGSQFVCSTMTPPIWRMSGVISSSSRRVLTNSVGFWTESETLGIGSIGLYSLKFPGLSWNSF